MEGVPRSAAAAANDTDVQALRDWVLRDNADGMTALVGEEVKRTLSNDFRYMP